RKCQAWRRPRLQAADGVDELIANREVRSRRGGQAQLDHGRGAGVQHAGQVAVFDEVQHEDAGLRNQAVSLRIVVAARAGDFVHHIVGNANLSRRADARHRFMNPDALDLAAAVAGRQVHDVGGRIGARVGEALRGVQQLADVRIVGRLAAPSRPWRTTARRPTIRT
ncbi:Uncharacterized protein APZ42_002692, partial [Daphnia magna]